MSKMLKVVGASWLRTKISSYILGILGILAILALFVGQIERSQEDGNYAATVFYSEKTGYRIEYWGQSNELAEIPKGVARAYFRRDIDTTGWSLLEVETQPSYPDQIQAYAAGVVEGALTWYLIHVHLENTIRAQCEGTPLEKQCNKLKDELDKSVKIWQTRAAERETDPLWHHISLHYTQISGIFTGWKYGVQRTMNVYDTDISDLYWLNSFSEVAEIQHKLNISLNDAEIDQLPESSSAFVKIVNETNSVKDNMKLYVAHNAAGSYFSMTRIIKRYKLNYHLTSAKNSSLAPGNSIVFSGYPGSVTSQDEYYILRGDKHKIVITGTTLKNYNHHLWREVNITEQVPTSARVTAANHLSSNASSWAHILASSNSGTASKQWLLVDFNRLQHLKPPVNNETEIKLLKENHVTETTTNKDVKHTVVHRASTGRSSGLLWLIEQVPGLTHSADLTEVLLKNGYWATYGLPFFKDIANLTNINHMEEIYGQIYSETNSPRAELFKQGSKNATTVDSIIKLMRHNNMTDSNNNTNICEDDTLLCQKAFWSVIGVRGDITNQHTKAYGVIDTKIVNGSSDSDKMDLFAISSPPYTEITPNTSLDAFNKGNIASIYTDQFDDDPNISAFKIRDLVKQQQEEAEQESLEMFLRNTILPFQWSESDFINATHTGLPDKWNFGPFKPSWSW